MKRLYRSVDGRNAQHDPLIDHNQHYICSTHQHIMIQCSEMLSHPFQQIIDFISQCMVEHTEPYDVRYDESNVSEFRNDILTSCAFRIDDDDERGQTFNLQSEILFYFLSGEREGAMVIVQRKNFHIDSNIEKMRARQTAHGNRKRSTARSQSFLSSIIVIVEIF